jgi:hypothetical protein
MAFQSAKTRVKKKKEKKKKKEAANKESHSQLVILVLNTVSPQALFLAPNLLPS